MTLHSHMRGFRSGLLTLCLVFAAVAAACGTSATELESSPPTLATELESSSSTPTPAAPVPSPTPGTESESSSSMPTPVAPVPSPTPETVEYSINPTWWVPPSLEEQIFESDVIVRASLLSAAAGTETVPSADAGVSPTYRPVQDLRFTVHEYLKGSGPNEVLVVVRGEHTYLTEAEARNEADHSVSLRNTTWDGRQGALFLRTSDSADLQVSGTSGGASGSTGQTDDLAFITDGAKSPPPTISLADLRAEIAETDATLKAGEGIEGYERCIRGKIRRERANRADPWMPLRLEKTLVSGSAAGAEVYRSENRYREPDYNRYWLSGPDAGLFQSLIVDDDSSSVNGYDEILTTARPLVTGTYRVFHNMQLYIYFPCNSVPEDAYTDWTVTVTATTGTLHEAFFDPVAIGTAVGADGSNGALEPASFTVGARRACCKASSGRTGPLC